MNSNLLFPTPNVDCEREISQSTCKDSSLVDGFSYYNRLLTIFLVSSLEVEIENDV